VQLWTAIVYWQRGEAFEEGTDFHRMLTAALATATATGDDALRGMALAIKGRSLTFSDQPGRAVAPLEEAIRIGSARDPIGSALAADSLSQAYAILGDFAKADATTAVAFDLARQSGDPISEIDAQISRSQVEIEKGNFEEAIRLARDGASKASALGVTMCTVVGNYFAGSAELAMGRPQAAIQPLQLSHDMATVAEAGWWKNMSGAALSSSSCALGDLDAARGGWDEALEVAARSHDTGAEASIRYQRAITLSQSPDPDWAAVAADLEWTSSVLETAGARPREARARLEYARALEELGRPGEADEQRRRANKLFVDLGIPAPAATSSTAPSAAGATGG
jgi:tetratricopeptide (TPR) repeat protein